MTRSDQDDEKILVGALECCDLPDLGIEGLHMRVDTGAATSSLHVDNMVELREGGKRWVYFDLHPDIYHIEQIIRTRAPIKRKRHVKSSSADREKRVVIETRLRMNGKTWPILLTLTDRSEMTYLMLLGREAMAGKIIVDPGSEYLLSADTQARLE